MPIKYILTNSLLNLSHVDVTGTCEDQKALSYYLRKNFIPPEGIYIIKISPPLDIINSDQINLTSMFDSNNNIFVAHYLPGSEQLVFKRLKSVGRVKESSDNILNVNNLARLFGLSYAQFASEEKKYFDQMLQFFPSNYLSLTKEEQFNSFYQLRVNPLFMKVLLSHWQLSCVILDALIKDMPNARAEVGRSRLGQVYILNQLRREFIPSEIRQRMPISMQQQLVFVALQSLRNHERQRTPIEVPQLKAGLVTQRIEHDYLEGDLEVPQELFCILSGQLFRQPVKIVSKHNNVVFYFEKEHLITALKQKPENPLNRDPLTVAEVEKLPIDEEMVRKVEAFKNQFRQNNLSSLSDSPHPPAAAASKSPMPIPAAASSSPAVVVPPTSSRILHIQSSMDELIAVFKLMNVIEIKDRLLLLISEIKTVDELNKCYSVIDSSQITSILKMELGPNRIFGGEGNTQRWQTVITALKDKAKELVGQYESQRKFISEGEHQIFFKIFSIPITRWSMIPLIETDYLNPYLEARSRLNGLNSSQPRNTRQER